MRTIDRLMDRYEVSHRNPGNVRIHLVCVPLITFSLLALFCFLPLPLAVPGQFAAIFSLGAFVYYLRLSRKGALLMGLASLLLIAAVEASGRRPAVAFGSAGIFALAWIGQFIGHEIEGRKPSFLEDLRFLLIGPLFVLKHLGLKL